VSRPFLGVRSPHRQPQFSGNSGAAGAAFSEKFLVTNRRDPQHFLRNNGTFGVHPRNAAGAIDFAKIP